MLVDMHVIIECQGLYRSGFVTNIIPENGLFLFSSLMDLNIQLSRSSLYLVLKQLSAKE